MRGFKVLACLVIAYANVAASYNPYSYNARFLPQTMSADAYSSMGDIDWAKRGIDNPIPEALYPDEKRGAVQKSYKYKQPYMRARPSLDAAYSPYQAYARYGGLVSKPQTRNNLGERQYSYASMADMDWGWKKRSQWPALLENEDYEIVPDDDMIDNLELEKKNLASLAAHNMFPEKRLLNAPKARPLILGKRDSDDLEILENDGNFNEEKRNLASIARSSRSGISSLIRNGGLRQKQT